MGRAESVIVIIKVAILVVFVVAAFIALPRNGFARLSPATWPGPLPIVTGAGVLFVGYEGFGLITNAAANMAKPRRELPRALYGSVAIVSVMIMTVLMEVMMRVIMGVRVVMGVVVEVTVSIALAQARVPGAQHHPQGHGDDGECGGDLEIRLAGPDVEAAPEVDATEPDEPHDGGVGQGRRQPEEHRLSKRAAHGDDEGRHHGLGVPGLKTVQGAEQDGTGQEQPGVALLQQGREILHALRRAGRRAAPERHRLSGLFTVRDFTGSWDGAWQAARAGSPEDRCAGCETVARRRRGALAAARRCRRAGRRAPAASGRCR